MTKLLSLALSPLALLALAAAAFASDIMVMNAEAPASLTPVSKTAAIYMILMNHGAEADVLKGLTTPVATHATPHRAVALRGRSPERLVTTTYRRRLVSGTCSS